MLEPHSRALLFDLLRPPDGHRLDVAIGTTFTLDLLALLTAPVAFSLFDVDDPAELVRQDSLSLLESLRRYADRITIFCQAGQIKFPRVQFPQLAYLEKAVVACRRPSAGSLFHPKVWVLRFVGPDGAVRYRLICLTRNLTFDRCWDTALALEGPLRDRQRAVAANNPLGDFIAGLPPLASEPVGPELRARIEMIESEVRRVPFELPEGFEEYRFHSLGQGGRATSFPFGGTGGRILIISPFVSYDGLSRLTRGRKGATLVTRPETIQQERCRTPEIERFFVLSTEANPSSDSEDAPASRGLHAKCYVIDDGWKARVLTGSANATESGFGRNVEFLVELIGSKSRFGIDATLSRTEGGTSLVDLLEEVTPPDSPVKDEIEEGLRAAIDKVRDAMVGLDLKGLVTLDEAGYTLRIRSSFPMTLPNGVVTCAWPVTLGKARCRALKSGPIDVSFEALSLEGISAFLAIEVQARVDGKELVDTFVLNVPLEGVPEDRRERLLRSLLTDRRRFVQYLMLLLSDEGLDLASQMESERATSDGDLSNPGAVAHTGLLERLVRTLERSPERLDDVARLIEDLSKPDGGAMALPVGFESIWNPVWQARQELKACTK